MDKNKQRDIEAMIKWLEEEKEKLNQPLQEVTAVSVTAKTQNMPVLYFVFNGQEEVLDDDTKKDIGKFFLKGKKFLRV